MKCGETIFEGLSKIGPRMSLLPETNKVAAVQNLASGRTKFGKLSDLPRR